MARVEEAGGVDWNHRAVTYETAAWVTNPSLLDWIESIVFGAMKDSFDRATRDLAILEIGCGTGALTERLRAGHRVIGIDPSEEMLVRARARCPWADLRIGHDPGQLPEGPFRAVVSRMVLHHVTDQPEDAVRRWMDLCAPGCPLIIAEGPPPVAADRRSDHFAHPANRLYRDAMGIKEPGRHVFDAGRLATWMHYTGGPDHPTRVTVHERWSQKNSVRQWVQAGGLPADDQERVLKLHRDAHPDAKAVYNIEITDDGDVLMRWRHAVVVGVRA